MMRLRKTSLTLSLIASLIYCVYFNKKKNYNFSSCQTKFRWFQAKFCCGSDFNLLFTDIGTDVLRAAIFK